MKYIQARVDSPSIAQGFESQSENRNTSAHKIHSIDLLYSKFKEIFQSLMESVFIIAGQICD